MIALLGEAVGALWLPCSATVVVPAVVLAVAGRGRWAVTAAAAAGLVVGAFVAVAWAPPVPPVVVGIALAAGAVGAARRRAAPTSTLGGALAGLAAGSLWQPCVGAALGDALTTALTSPWAALVPIGAYVAVLTLPGAAATALLRVGGGRATSTVLPVGAAVAGLALAVLVAVGLGDDVTGALFRWST